MSTATETPSVPTVPTIDQLINDLRTEGEATVPILPGTGTQAARTLLIGAARAAGIRVRVHRSTDPTAPLTMVAEALTPAAAIAQARRGSLLRAAKQVTDAAKILESELVSTGVTDEYDVRGDVLDLKEIAEDLQFAAEEGL